MLIIDHKSNACTKYQTKKKKLTKKPEFNFNYSIAYNNLYRPQTTELESLESASPFVVQPNKEYKQRSNESSQFDDTYSTDSSSFDDELKKRRRKLRFPFSKKTFQKSKHN